MATNDIGVTVPLLILISLGIASLNRQYNLSDIGVDTLELGFWKWKAPISHLGPFTVTHGLNHVFVLVAISLSQTAYAGNNAWASFISRDIPPTLLLTGILLIYALFYPYLEVTEYQKIPPTENSIFPVSIQVHYLLTLITILVSTADTYLMREFGPAATGIDTIVGVMISTIQMITGISEFIIIPVTVLLYSSTLQMEIQAKYSP